MQNQSSSVFTWQDYVKEYEIDIQGIVNHAHYCHYFHQARSMHASTLGVDWKTWHDDGFDFIVYHMDMTFCLL